MVILSIQSHVAYGHVGNSAAVFPLQRLGFEVWPIHTVQFAAHAGYGPPQGHVFSAQSITDVVRGLEARGVLHRCAGVISGYVGTAEIGTAILDAVARVKRANEDALYCCDPVIGDADGGAYVTAGVADFFRDAALPCADIMTPNQFELEFLTGSTSTTRLRVINAVRQLSQLGPRILLATSVRTDEMPEREIDTVAADAHAVFRVRTPCLDTTVHGTGDLISALFFAHYLRSRSVSEALSRSVSAVFAVLEKTAAAKNEEMALIAAQDDLVAPPRLFGAEPL